MASSREITQTATARPLAHRPSLSNASASAGLPGRQTHARNNSHSAHPHSSLLTTSLNPNHRVTRRKSVTAPNANLAAVTAALRDGEAVGAVPIGSPAGRRNTMSKASGGRGGLVGSLPSPPSSLPSNKGMIDERLSRMASGSAVDDQNDLSADDGSTKGQKSRVRRASDGQPLTKDGKKSNRVELRCEQCGKGYKHSSCLTKHLWEHTPEWSLTSKLLISKHQQVQLLEAASVLVTMTDQPSDGGAPSPPDSARDFPSDPESAVSPGASGYSDQAERQSSADTTPPPTSEYVQSFGTPFQSKRHSSTGGISRSYQLDPSVVPGGRHSRRVSEQRPTSSGVNNTGQDDRDLAAAVELLSCSFNSNGNNGGASVAGGPGSTSGSNGTVMLADAPPVPPVPAQYLDQATSIGSGRFMNSFPGRQPESFTRGDVRRGSEDIKMGDPDSGLDEDDFDVRPRGRSEDEDDGVFGCMEE